MMRINGLDSIRFFLAGIVAVGHYAANYTRDLSFLGDRGAWFLNNIIGLLFNGQAAVIVFFVLSGFVIHYPNALSSELQIKKFYIRRYIRIIPPSAVAVAFFFAANIDPDDGDWNNTIFWSIICELIYYTFYPILFKFRYRIKEILILSYLIGIGIILYNHEAAEANQNFNAMGNLTFLMGLPCWIGGAFIADRISRNSERIFLSQNPVVWRIICLSLFGITLIIKQLHTYIGIFSSNIVLFYIISFAIYCWIWTEVRFSLIGGKQTSAMQFFDHLGQSSYSLYLIHMVPIMALGMQGKGFIGLTISMIGVGIATAIFYLVIEKPCHGLARRLAQKSNRTNH
jgi:peptidoglycan/LPS O-acetylase OafA/YrhL